MLYDPFTNQWCLYSSVKQCKYPATAFYGERNAVSISDRLYSEVPIKQVPFPIAFT